MSETVVFFSKNDGQKHSLLHAWATFWYVKRRAFEGAWLFFLVRMRQYSSYKRSAPKYGNLNFLPEPHKAWSRLFP
jgi:hypothetical protein